MSYLTKLARSRFRVVRLWTRGLPESAFETMARDPGYDGIVDDLMAYTGFSAEQLKRRLLRDPRTHFKSEFAWFRPEDRAELSWFYRCSAGYLFANAAHRYWPKLDILKEGRVLDYGAGAGCNTIRLAGRGLGVDFLEIGRLQADFIKFRAARRGLDNVAEAPPYHEGRFDPVGAITETYDAIAAVDVLEHVPDYHRLVRHLISRLRPGGLIVENSPFAHCDGDNGDVSIHLAASMPMAQAMEGMEPIEKGVWQKRTA